MSDQNIQKLITEITALLQTQTEITAACLSGSYGRDDQDAYSDIDFVAFVDSQEYAHTVFAALRNTIMDRSDIIFVKTLPDGLTLNAVTEDWTRFDITIVPPQKYSHYFLDELKPLFGDERMKQIIAASKPVETQSLANSIKETTEEFIRILGLLPVVLGREDYVISLTGIQLMKDLLIRLMRLENGTWMKRGALSLKKHLSVAQYHILQDIPSLRPERESILELNRYLAGHTLSYAKKLYAQHAMEWPLRFEQATLRHIKLKTGLDLITHD